MKKSFLEIREKNLENKRLGGIIEKQYSSKSFERFIKKLSRKIIRNNNFGKLQVEINVNENRFIKFYTAEQIKQALIRTGLFGEDSQIFFISFLSDKLRIFWG